MYALSPVFDSVDQFIPDWRTAMSGLIRTSVILRGGGVFTGAGNGRSQGVNICWVYLWFHVSVSISGNYLSHHSTLFTFHLQLTKLKNSWKTQDVDGSFMFFRWNYTAHTLVQKLGLEAFWQIRSVAVLHGKFHVRAGVFEGENSNNASNI